MSYPRANRGAPSPRRYFVPYFVLAIGLLSTLLFSYYVWRVSQAKDRERFNSSTQELSTYVRGRPRLYMEVLRAATGLFAVSPSINPTQFKAFIEKLELAEQFPGAQGIGYMVRVSRDENRPPDPNGSSVSLKDFGVWGDVDESRYSSSVHFESLVGKKASPDFEIHKNAACVAAMTAARDTGLPALTGKISVGTNHNEPGFIIYVPIYQNDVTPQTVEGRAAALAGFVYTQFIAADYVTSVQQIKTFSDIDFRLYDGPNATPENLLYDTASNEGDVGSGIAPRLSFVNHVEVAGHPWTIAFSSRPEFISAGSRTSLYFTAIGGLLVTLLLFGLTSLQVSARKLAESSAAELGESERKVRKTLNDRERAERALRESEERYRDLVENANDIVYTLDLQGNLTSVNKAAEVITGYPHKELLGKNLGAFLSRESLETNTEMLDRKLHGEERTNYEMELRAHDGRLLTFEISSKLVKRDGKPVGVQGIARDITTRRHAEEALREADQRALSEYERLLERVAALAQTLGTARDLLPIFRGLLEFARRSVPCDGLFVSLYDPVRDVRNACYGWGDDKEIDTTELPPMPVNFTGPNSRAVRTNQVIITNDYQKETLGHPAVLVGPDNGLRPQSSLSAPMAVMGRIIGTIETQSYERDAYSVQHATAMRMASNLTAVAIENVRLLERESTARASAEESNRLKDEFLATVSHELRTPLTAILGWSRMLEGAPMETDMTKRAIDTIKRNAKSQAQIIDDILDVSRIITGNLYLELNPIELAPVLEAAINVVRPTAEAKNIQIAVKVPQEPVAVPGDANRLQQVFWNLLSNAVKFTPANGKVSVELQHTTSEVEITVSDTGQGISPSFMPFVFDRFRQADSTSTRQHGGLGLGLAIARHLVEIHGGSISARSDGDGKGAKFTVKLPIVGGVSAIEATRVPEQIEIDVAAKERLQTILSGLNVLLVDDDNDTLELLSAALSQRSAKVSAVSSARAAIESIHISRPDVLISDIAMPGEDGYQLMQNVLALQLQPALPAIAITAYAKDEDRQKALAAGYNRYLSKPVELGEFIAAVAELARGEAPTNGDRNQ